MKNPKHPDVKYRQKLEAQAILEKERQHLEQKNMAGFKILCGLSPSDWFRQKKFHDFWVHLEEPMAPEEFGRRFKVGFQDLAKEKEEEKQSV
ncbi:MAG: hypothetical protein ACUVT9_05360 [Candidatus Bathycorpusculaceae bacterium]